jgi:hypothetical protein
MNIGEKISAAYDWVQKRTFLIIFFTGIGIIVGVFGTNVFNERNMVRAINLGSFEFRGYLFNVEPSSRPKFFKEEGDKSLATMMIEKAKDQPAAAAPVQQEPVKEELVKKGKK